MDIRDIEGVIESLLFAAGDELSIDKIVEIIEVDKKTTKSIINNMISNCRNANRGIQIREINNSYILCTKSEHHDYLKKLFEPRQRQGLSQAAFEVLGIVAYNSPVTRAKIEQIRGVNSDSAINKLLDRNLIREAGKADTPGKPMTYETTGEFLKSFGFKSISELPKLGDFELFE